MRRSSGSGNLDLCRGSPKESRSLDAIVSNLDLTFNGFLPRVNGDKRKILIRA